MAISTYDRVSILLAEIDAVSAEEEHRSTTLSSGEPDLGLGLVALALNEQWRPKRTERLKLHRDDAVETEFLCELDLDLASKITRTTARSSGMWLPLHRLQSGLMPPASATDETGDQLAVMSGGEVAAHVGAGVAQILGSSVFRDAFAKRPRAPREANVPHSHRRRTPAIVILREAVTRILIRSWSGENVAYSTIKPKDRADECSCAAFSEQVPLTLREFGLARYLLHQAAHSWLEQSQARRASAIQNLGSLEYLSSEQPGHIQPHVVVDAGLNALEVASRGAIVVAHARRATGRTTISTTLPPRRPETDRRRGIPSLLLDAMVVPYEIKLSGLRLNQAVGLDARVEAGVELTSGPMGKGDKQLEGSHVSVCLQRSAFLTSPPSGAIGGAAPGSSDATSQADLLAPHPAPEFEMAVDNLERAQRAHPPEAASGPLALGAFAALNRCGAHASQVARLLDVTKEPNQSQVELELIADLRDFAQECQDTIEDQAEADYRRLAERCARARPLAKRCAQVLPRRQQFFDADHQPGVFRCQIGRKDIPDRFIRPLAAEARLYARLEPGLASALRNQVIAQFAMTSVLLVAMMLVVWFVRPDSEPVITILLAVPAVSVFLQRIPNVATLRSRLEGPYRRWQYLSLVAPVVAAFAALPLQQCNRDQSGMGLVQPCDGQLSPWLQIIAPVLSLVLMGFACWRLYRIRQVEPAFSVTSFEPKNPSYDELRQIGQTAADSAARSTQRGPWYVVARAAGPAIAAAGPNCMALKTTVPTSEFWVRLGSRNYEFTSVRAEAGAATTELLRGEFARVWPGDDPPIVRSFSSIADAPVFGAGQLSEAWLAWNTPGRSDPVGPASFVRDVALLGAAYDGPLSYFHLRSWENGHLFSRVGTLLSQRGHRDEVAFEGTVSSIARKHHPGPNSYSGHDYLTFLPPTFVQRETPKEGAHRAIDATSSTDAAKYWDVVLLATARSDTAYTVLSLLAGRPGVSVIDGSMTIVRGIEAMVIALRIEGAACNRIDVQDPNCDCPRCQLDTRLRTRLRIENNLAHAPRMLWRNVDQDYQHIDRFQAERDRRTLWVGWSGKAGHADSNWLFVQLRAWFDLMANHAEEELQIGDLGLDYLVCRHRRGTTQVGRARISFLTGKGADADSFGVWEATLTKMLQYVLPPSEDDPQRGVPTDLVVDVQRFEPRSQRYSGSKLGGQAP